MSFFTPSRREQTLLLWVLYLLSIIFVEILFKCLHIHETLIWLCDIVVAIAFMIFMKKRKYYLDNPHLPEKCRRGKHDLKYTDDYFMVGTGKYIGDQEIKERKLKTHIRCQTPGCDYNDDTSYL